MSVYLNSYYPICHTDFGKKAVEQFGLHPLVDGSIRREPDFNHPLCPISGLCRPGKMANFVPGDIVVYKTNGSHILTGVLEITKIFATHKEAAEWLQGNGYVIPSNNILTNPLPLSHSHAHGYMSKVGKGKKLDEAVHSQWNNVYLQRGSNSSSSYFLTTNPIYNAVAENVQPKDYVYIDGVLREGMGSIPKTNWRPERIPDEVLAKIMGLIPRK